MASGILLKNKKKFYITTPIFYVNDVPHIGHTYTTVMADILSRYQKMTGAETFFLTGTDEHGAKVEEKAVSQGKSPRDYVDEISAKFRSAWDELSIAYDNFIRTTDAKHILAAQKAMQALYDKGDIYLGVYEGLYCGGCEQFKSEKELVNGLCPDHLVPPEVVKEESYMFKMSKYRKEILKKIENEEFKIIPEERKNEILSFLEHEGLKDISFSRKYVKWGIPLPWDGSHTIYVWADAFLNYLTGLNWSGDPATVPEMWPPTIQVMSKDILRVHATIWPAMLIALNLTLPKTIYIHGFFLVEGQKMSKSLGNVISPADLTSKYGADGARYLLAAAVGYGRDADISRKWLDEKYNADLANGLGNLAARALALSDKLKEKGIGLMNEGGKQENWEGNTFRHNVSLVWELYHSALRQFRIERTLEIVFGADNLSGMVKFLDNYITITKPWELIKNDDARAGTVIYNILERLRHTALMLYPFMPGTSGRVMESLGFDLGTELKKDFQELTKWGGLPVDAKISKGEILFPRITQH